MSASLATIQGGLSERDDWGEEQVTVLRNTIARDCNDAELQLFIATAKRTGLDPFARQIFAIKRGGKLSIQTSVDGFRLIAERTGDYMGQDASQWCGEDGRWVDVWLSRKPPMAARAAVYRRGFAKPMVAVARFDSYAQRSPLWDKMPENMLAKCAECLALRKAFPNDLSGLYSREEMEQVEDQPRQLSAVQADVRADDPERYDAASEAHDKERAEAEHWYRGQVAVLDKMQAVGKRLKKEDPQADEERDAHLSEKAALFDELTRWVRRYAADYRALNTKAGTPTRAKVATRLKHAAEACGIPLSELKTMITEAAAAIEADQGDESE